MEILQFFLIDKTLNTTDSTKQPADLKKVKTFYAIHDLHTFPKKIISLSKHSVSWF